MSEMTLKVRLSAEGAELIGVTQESAKVLDKLAGKEEKVGKAGEKAGRGIDSFAKSARKNTQAISVMKRSLVALAASFISLRGAKDLVATFRVQERAVQKLDASIASMGRSTRGLSQQLQNLASQIQSEGILGDEALIEGQSFLTTYSQITDDLLPRSTRVMADLAAKMGGDIVSAANLVGKASMGMTGELSRVGITLSDTAKQSKDFELIVSEIESQVSGTNKALAKGSGVYDQLGNRIGDAKEKLGEFIAMHPAVQAFASGMVSMFENAVNAATGFGAAIARSIHGSGGDYFDLTLKELNEKGNEIEEKLAHVRSIGEQDRFQAVIFDDEVFASQVVALEKLQARLEQIETLRAHAMDAPDTGGKDFIAKVSPEVLASFEKVQEKLEKQLALHGQAGIAAELHYDIVKAGLDKSAPELVRQLKNLAKQADAQEAATKATVERDKKRKKINEQLKRDSEELNRIIADRKKTFANNLAALEESLLTETEIAAREYDRQLKLFQQAVEEKKYSKTKEIEFRQRLEQRYQDTLQGIEKRAAARRERQTREDARRLAEQIPEPFKNALRDIQSQFTTFFEHVFRGGVNSFGELAKAVKNIFIKLIGNLATLKLFDFAKGRLAGGGGQVGALASLLGVSGGASAGGGIGGLAIPGMGTGIAGWLDGLGAKWGFGPGSMGGLSTPASAGSLSMSSLSSVLGAGAIGFAGGGMFANLLGLNSKGGSIGGGLGAAIGMATPLGPVGGLIGGALGSLVGGLFGKKKPSDKAQGVTLSATGVREWGLSGKKFDSQLRQTVDGIGAELQKTLQAIEEQIGARLSGSLQVKLGRRDGHYITGSDGRRQSVKGDTKAIFRTATQQLMRQIQGGDKKLLSVLRSAFAKGGDVNKALAAVRQAKAISEQIAGLTAENGPLVVLARRFDELKKNAAKYGLSLAQVNQAYITSINQLKEETRLGLQQIAGQARQLLNIDSLKQYQTSLSYSESAPLSPLARFNQARTLLDKEAQAALAGDIDAGNRFPQLAQQVLKLGRTTFASGSDYGELFKEVNTTLNEVISSRESTLAGFTDSVNIHLDNSVNKQIAALEAMRDALLMQERKAEARLVEIREEIRAAEDERRAQEEAAAAARARQEKEMVRGRDASYWRSRYAGVRF